MNFCCAHGCRSEFVFRASTQEHSFWPDPAPVDCDDNCRDLTTAGRYGILHESKLGVIGRIKSASSCGPNSRNDEQDACLLFAPDNVAQVGVWPFCANGREIVETPGYHL